MKTIPVTVEDEVADTYGQIYGYSPDSKLTIEEFIGDSLATYLENAHVGYQVRAAEATARQPFADKQQERTNRARPEPVVVEPESEPVRDSEPTPDPEPTDRPVR